MGLSVAAETSAAATARSAAGSLMRKPPANDPGLLGDVLAMRMHSTVAARCTSGSASLTCDS